MKAEKFDYANGTVALETDFSKGIVLNKVNNVELVELTIKHGGLVPEHSLPMEVVFYVVSGKGKLVVEEKEWEMQPGDSVKVKANCKRIWSNNAKADLKLIVMKHFNEIPD